MNDPLSFSQLNNVLALLPPLLCKSIALNSHWQALLTTSSLMLPNSNRFLLQ